MLRRWNDANTPNQKFYEIFAWSLSLGLVECISFQRDGKASNVTKVGVCTTFIFSISQPPATVSRSATADMRDAYKRHCIRCLCCWCHTIRCDGTKRASSYAIRRWSQKDTNSNSDISICARLSSFVLPIWKELFVCVCATCPMIYVLWSLIIYYYLFSRRGTRLSCSYIGGARFIFIWISAC